MSSYTDLTILLCMAIGNLPMVYWQEMCINSGCIFSWGVLLEYTALLGDIVYRGLGLISNKNTINELPANFIPTSACETLKANPIAWMKAQALPCASTSCNFLLSWLTRNYNSTVGQALPSSINILHAHPSVNVPSVSPTSDLCDQCLIQESLLQDKC